MELGLRGKRAWVVGASSGLGRAVASALAHEGANVAVSARREDRLTDAVEELREAGAPAPFHELLDVTDERALDEAPRRVIGRLGGLDVLIVNQGGPKPGEFGDMGAEDFETAYRLLLASAFGLTKAAVPALQEDGGGTIVYITSTSTKETLPNLFLSNVMRLAIVGMAKSLSRELGPAGVRVLCASPGRIATERAEQIDERTAERKGVPTEQVKAQAESSIPAGRYGTPGEFGDVVAFLCSPRASYVSGANVVIDGAKSVAVT